MALSLLFFGAIRYSIFDSFCAGYFVLFLLINFFVPKKKKEIYSKVASHQ